MSSRRQTHYRGKTLNELQSLTLDELVELLPSRQRRSLTRQEYWNHERSKLLGKLRNAKEAMDKGKEVIVKTHIRDFVVLPEFVGLTVEIYNGKEYTPIKLTFDKVGDYFAQYSHARKLVRHSAPGIGATRSSMYVPLK
ncbi:MAG: 30S ribosomal protein S19 [Candidatus Heimdallarchaeota archaeon LC_2]|uniref:Putative 30S ribosomal protein S19 n=1 Tax=uncultured organism TaxID=155900 RepID=A0A0F6PXD8_9ZZZZ|nr:putative 30S ribosomal protein S19 [uncultured organism]OLS28547.1 MAG: 30S ribosomal protein S19 [Candidatus Heimdallarchaeota archaeon LC_2]